LEEATKGGDFKRLPGKKTLGMTESFEEGRSPLKKEKSSVAGIHPNRGKGNQPYGTIKPLQAKTLKKIYATKNPLKERMLRGWV